MVMEHSLPVMAPPGRVKIWIAASRPFSFTASMTPVLIGSVLGVLGGVFHWGRFGLALAGSLCIHIGTNMVNDYYDHRSGVDTLASRSGSQVLPRQWLTPDELYWAGIAAFAVGAGFGLVLVWLCGWPILALGVASVLAGYFYTANPVSLAYVALGEATVFVFMGPVMIVGAYYVQRETFELAPLLVSLPVGCLVAAILQANNIRDIEADRSHGKHTLATAIGRRAADWELAVLVYGAFVLTGVLVAFNLAPWPVLVTGLSLRLAVPAVRRVFAHGDLDGIDEQTAKLHLEYGGLLIIGLLLSHLLGWGTASGG